MFYVYDITIFALFDILLNAALVHLFFLSYLEFDPILKVS